MREIEVSLAEVKNIDATASRKKLALRISYNIALVGLLGLVVHLTHISNLKRRFYNDRSEILKCMKQKTDDGGGDGGCDGGVGGGAPQL